MAEHDQREVHPVSAHGVAEGEPPAHRHGEMDITDQQQMFGKFVSFWVWQVVAVAAILIFLAIFNS